MGIDSPDSLHAQSEQLPSVASGLQQQAFLVASSSVEQELKGGCSESAWQLHCQALGDATIGINITTRAQHTR
tara:strand:- start:5786 stop:6004 length:219 start_codon:yes stop_codon:yes gene_type:complete